MSDNFIQFGQTYSQLPPVSGTTTNPSSGQTITTINPTTISISSTTITIPNIYTTTTIPNGQFVAMGNQKDLPPLKVAVVVWGDLPPYNYPDKTSLSYRWFSEMSRSCHYHYDMETITIDSIDALLNNIHNAYDYAIKMGSIKTAVITLYDQVNGTVIRFPFELNTNYMNTDWAFRIYTAIALNEIDFTKENCK